MSDDPTADFLAREKALLGDDADMFASGGIPGMNASSGEGAGHGFDSFPDLDDGESTWCIRRRHRICAFATASTSP